jgi:AbiV family abortive infection protein
MSKRKKREDSYIRKSDFSQGLQLCRENALSFLESTEILINENKANHAVILFQFAKEEIGKLAWLLNLSKEMSEIIQVPEGLFSKHNYKSEKAEELFGYDSWVVKGGFEKRYYYCGFEGGFDLGIESDHDTRLKCAFVDYDNQLKVWIKPGIETHKGVFLATIERVREKLNGLSF